jgi:hypothetical protein
MKKMKKLLLTTLVALSTIFGLNAQSQTDLHVTLVSPKAMSTIYNQTAFDIEVNVHNMGKYHFLPSDTMYFFLFIDTNWITSGGMYYMKMVTGKSIVAGGNLTFTAISNFSLNLGGLSGVHEFGTFLYCERDTSTATGKNNFSSNRVYFSPWGLSVNPIVKSEVNTYPNPTSDILNISTTMQGNKSACIYDISGREVYSFEFSGDRKSIETVSLPNGIYNLVVRNEKNEIENIKIQISK